MYTITLSNGIKLENLELNGNNYIAESLIDDSVFKNNLKKVEISDGTTTETYEDMVLSQNTTYGDGKSWFILAEKTEQEKEREKSEQVRADMDYLAIMTGVEL